MTAIEILATVFAVLVLLKLFFIIACPRLWLDLSRRILKNYAVTLTIYALLAVVVSYYILAAIPVIEVAAVMLMTSLWVGLSFIAYPTMVLQLREEMLRQGLSRLALPLAIWGLFAIWVLYRILTRTGA